jgi:hypothetical protein
MFWKYISPYLHHTLEEYSFKCRCKKCGLLAKSFIRAETISSWEANEEYSMFCNSLRWDFRGDNNLSFYSQNKKKLIYLWAKYWGQPLILLRGGIGKNIETISFIQW